MKNHKIYIKRSGIIGHHTLTGISLLPTLSPNKGSLKSFLNGGKITRKYIGSVISWGAIFSKKPFQDAEIVTYSNCITEDILRKLGVKAKHKTDIWEKAQLKNGNFIKVSVI